MGGMFDPVHNGHLHIARTMLGTLQLDELALLPCGNPVHRDNDMAAAEHRLAMLDLALTGQQGLIVDDRECRTGAPSYALGSLQAIREERPGARLYYLMGQDAFNNFHTWYGWREILAIAHVVIAGRPGYTPTLAEGLGREYTARLVADIGKLKASPWGKFFNLELAPMDISSSMIRDRLARHEAVTGLVPPAVADYIRTHGLYTPENNA